MMKNIHFHIEFVLQGKLYVNLTGYGNATNFKVLILPLLLYCPSSHLYNALIYVNFIFQTYCHGKTMTDVKEIKVYIYACPYPVPFLSLPLYVRNILSDFQFQIAIILLISIAAQKVKQSHSC